MDCDNDEQTFFVSKQNHNQINKLNLSNQLVQVMNLITDIVEQCGKILTNDKWLTRLSYDFFFKIDIDGQGTITLKQLIVAFGHNDKRVDNELESTFSQLASNEADSGIDKTEFKKQLVKGIELLVKNLIDKAYLIEKQSNDHSRFLNSVTDNKMNEESLIEDVKKSIVTLMSTTEKTGNQIDENEDLDYRLLYDNID